MVYIDILFLAIFQFLLKIIRADNSPAHSLISQLNSNIRTVSTLTTKSTVYHMLYSIVCTMYTVRYMTCTLHTYTYIGTDLRSQFKLFLSQNWITKYCKLGEIKMNYLYGGSSSSIIINNIVLEVVIIY